MDEMQKTALKGELMMVKTMISAVTSQTSVLQQTVFPVTGPVVTISSMPMVAQSFKMQSEALDRLAKLVDKVIDAS